MKVIGKRVYRFNGVELDPYRGCLSRNGEELAVRQKSLGALLYLLEQRHRLVSKEELIERVWEGMAVTDDALVQLIKEIRQSLGDDARQPRFIKTVPRGGYRFIATVEEIDLDMGAAFDLERQESVEIEYEEELTSELRSNTAAGWSRANLPSARLLSNRVVLPGAVAALLLLGGATATYLVARSSSRQATLAEVALPPSPGKKPLVVMYFDNQSGSPDLDWLREGLADMLITNLSRSKHLSVLGRQQLHLLLERAGQQRTDAIRLDDAIGIGRKSNAEVIVLGSFARLGQKVRINVQLYGTQTAQPLGTESTVADNPDDILDQIDLLSWKLAAHLGASPGEKLTTPDFAGVMTSSLDAYRYYSLALEQSQMFQFNESIALLEKALALDPKFAMAHARIGYVYAVRLGRGEVARAHLAKAWQFSDNLNERDKLFIAAWSANASYESERVISTYRELLARYPLETEAWRGLGWTLHRLDRKEEALEVVRQGLLTDPESGDLYNLLGAVSWRLGRHNEALTAFERYTQLTPNDPNAWDSLGLLHQWMGQYEQAAAAYQRALALNPESRVAVIHLGTLYTRQGRYREAIQQYERHFQIAQDDLQRSRSFQYIAWARLRQGDLPGATAAVNEEVKYDPQSLGNSLVLALDRGDHGAAQRAGDAWLTPATYNVLNERGFLRIWNHYRGYLALRRGRSDEAIDHLRAAVHQGPVEWNFDVFEDCLANAYLELGRLDEAIAEYERILRVNPRYPLAHYHLAQAWERKGQPEQARANYEQFLQVWKNADSDIPELVNARNALSGTAS